MLKIVFYKLTILKFGIPIHIVFTLFLVNSKKNIYIYKHFSFFLSKQIFYEKVENLNKKIFIFFYIFYNFFQISDKN